MTDVTDPYHALGRVDPSKSDAPEDDRVMEFVKADRFSIRFAAGLALIAALLVLLAGCAGTRGGPIPYDVQDFGKPDEPVTFALEDGYKIAPMDTLKITVFKMADLSGEYQVDLTGRISMPLLGELKAVDMTTAELDAVLTEKFGQKYLQSPDVSVGIKSSTRRNVTVDGSVRQPGIFQVDGPMTLLQAVAMARGADENANTKRVAIFRQIKGKRVAAAFDLVSIRRGQMDDPPVYAGDIIMVDGSAIKAAQKQLLQAVPFFTFLPI